MSQVLRPSAAYTITFPNGKVATGTLVAVLVGGVQYGRDVIADVYDLEFDDPLVTQFARPFRETRFVFERANGNRYVVPESYLRRQTMNKFG
jgi:hypothetical protein